MSAHPVDVHVGKRMRMKRNMLGMSQEDLGKSVGVTFQQVQKYERGTNRVGCSRLYEIAQVFNVAVGYFFENFDAEASSGATGFAEEDSTFESENINSKEASELIQAYYRITNPEVRNTVLALLKALQTSSSKSTKK